MRTSIEIEELKQSWLNDPSTILEDTVGFEEHYRELRLFREQAEANWREKEITRQLEKCEKLGIWDNVKLLTYIESLEHQIVKMNEEITKLKEREIFNALTQ